MPVSDVFTALSDDIIEALMSSQSLGQRQTVLEKLLV